MTGNTLTTNPITGTNAYANGAYGTTPQGFWGNTGGIGGSTPFGFGTQAFQPQVTNPINTLNPFTTPMIQPTTFVGQTTPWQTGFTTQQFGLQGPVQTILQNTPPQVLNTILQTTPPQVVNSILQTTPPQVLPYILNALACQQVCQQVLAQNTQAVTGFPTAMIGQPFLGYGTTNQGQVGFGSIGGFVSAQNPFGVGYTQNPFVGGYNTNPFQVGFQPQVMQPGGCAGCTPGVQQWVPNMAFQGGFGQIVPQQPWFNTTYGTW